LGDMVSSTVGKQQPTTSDVMGQQWAVFLMGVT